MKTSLKIFSILVFTLIIQNLSFAQDNKVKSKNPFEGLKLTNMSAKNINSLRDATFKDKNFKELKKSLESKKYAMGSSSNDIFIISGKVQNFKKKMVDITVELYSFKNADKSDALISVIKSGSKILYSSAVVITDKKNMKSWYEYILKPGAQVVGRVTPVVEEAASKTKQFMECYGQALQSGVCKDVCSAGTILACVGAGTAIGTLVGTAVAAVAAVPTLGVSAGAIPVSALVGTFGGFVGCLGFVCGPCAFGQFLACAALYL